MAELSLPKFDFDQTLTAPLAAVNAELAVYCKLNHDSGLSSRLQDNTSGLTVHVIMLNAPGQEYGDCGRILIQFLTDQKTRLSFEVAAPYADDIARFMEQEHKNVRMPLSGRNPKKLTLAEFESGFSVLRNLRLQALRVICTAVIKRVEMPANPGMGGGRPGLPTEEKIRRLALLLLEERLKQKNPGYTRGEFVFQVQQKLQLPIDMNTIKNAVNLLARARKEHEQDVIAQAEALADQWQLLMK